MTSDERYGQVVREALGELHYDEPVFLLRGQDLLAPRAIRAYAEELRREALLRGGALRAMAEQVDARAESFLDWQKDHPERTKYPD